MYSADISSVDFIIALEVPATSTIIQLFRPTFVTLMKYYWGGLIVAYIVDDLKNAERQFQLKRQRRLKQMSLGYEMGREHHRTHKRISKEYPALFLYISVPRASLRFHSAWRRKVAQRWNIRPFEVAAQRRRRRCTAVMIGISSSSCWCYRTDG